MEDRRTRNISIFKDTLYKYENYTTLKSSINYSITNQELILENDSIHFQEDKTHRGKIIVSNKRTLEAAEIYSILNKNVTVLNFASATNPGGGVTYGSSAQEESICRCSTLFPCLDNQDMWNNFYIPHREKDNPLYNNDCIYTPSITVFKSDTNFPEIIDESLWWNVNVITCAAPNLRNRPSNIMNPCAGTNKANISNENLYKLLTKRIQRIFEIAIANKTEVLILGAFGCGAFRNPPNIVAEVFATLTKKYRYNFDVIEYAVFHTENEKENYNAFKSAMRQFQ